MSEWKEYKLGDIATFSQGIQVDPDKQLSENRDGYIRFIRIVDYSKDGSEPPRYIEYPGDRYVVSEDDLVMIRYGSQTAGKIVRGIGGAIANNTFKIVLLENIATKAFIYYLLSQQSIYDYFMVAQASSTMPAITFGMMNGLDISVPSIKEQERIAGILSSLDDKIDLLTRQNATLEAMAETIFRQYFIENPKPDWKDGVIADIAKHSKIAIHPQKQPAELFYHYSIPSFDNAKTPTLDLGVGIQSNKYKVSSNSILFSKLNPHKDKRVWLLLNGVHNNSVCSTEFQIIEPINKEYLYFVYGWLTHSENYNDIASGVGGTSGSHQRIDPATIFSFTCPIIDIDYIRLYNSQAKPLFEKQINNQEQIRSLTKLRDTLLPKLMNNEIKI